MSRRRRRGPCEDCGRGFDRPIRRGGARLCFECAASRRVANSASIHRKCGYWWVRYLRGMYAAQRAGKIDALRAAPPSGRT